MSLLLTCKVLMRFPCQKSRTTPWNFHNRLEHCIGTGGARSKIDWNSTIIYFALRSHQSYRKKRRGRSRISAGTSIFECWARGGRGCFLFWFFFIIIFSYIVDLRFITQLNFGSMKTCSAWSNVDYFWWGYLGKYIHEETASCWCKTNTNKKTSQEGDLKRSNERNILGTICYLLLLYYVHTLLPDSQHCMF